MGKTDRMITDIRAIETIIRACDICRLALTDGNRPYIIPLCFGYRDRMLFFHTGEKGKKIDMLKLNNQVCFELENKVRVVSAENGRACDFSVTYESVIGYGKAFFVDDPDEKIKALDILMENYGNPPFEYRPLALDRTRVIRVEIEKMSGKRN